MKTIIIGAGEFGREILGIIHGFKNINTNEFIGFLDDDTSKSDVIGTIKNHNIIAEAVYICAIGNPEAKLRIAREFLAKGANFPPIIHSSAILANTAFIGKGSIIFPGCYIANNANIGDFVVVNFNSGIGHDVIIGDGSTICSNCDVTGKVIFGKCVYMGSSATVAPGKKMGDNVKIGIGSAVTRSFLEATTIMGVPAKRIIF